MLKRKILAGLLLITTLICAFGGCSTRHEREKQKLEGSGRRGVMGAQLDMLTEAIGNGDAEAIVEMFSPYARDQIGSDQELLELAQELIDTFPDWEGGVSPTEVNYASEPKNGSFTQWLKPIYNFTADYKYYQLRMIICSECDDDRDKLGLQAIQLVETDENGYVSAPFLAKDENCDFGIFLWE